MGVIYEYADWNWRVRFHTVLALADAFLEDGKLDIRLAAVEILARVSAGNIQRAIDILASNGCHLHHGRHWDWQVRGRALCALGGVPALDRVTVDAIVAGLDDDVAAVRSSA